ncbi:MAG: adenylate/guanylate cyclase domain-containing protein, partial [Comamonadaceae bacterium]
MSTSSSADSRPPRLRRFRVDVSTIILLVVVVQSLLLLGLGYWGAQRLVSAVGESAHRADHLRVEDKVNSFLGKAMSVVEAVAASTSVRTGDGQGADSAELLWVLLQQSPELDSLYVATDAGRMVMAQRYPEPAVRHVVRERGATVETWEYKGPTSLRADAQNSLVTRHTGEHATHNDPRSRAWFQAAARQGRPAWTAPYLFALAQEPGVSYAIPAWGEDGDANRGDGPGKGAGNGRSTGRVIGTAAGSGTRMRVASGDVTLGRLSDFVSQFSRAGYGDSALLSADRHVLARSDLPGRLQRLAPPSDGLLGAIHARMLDDGSAHDTASVHFPLTHEGTRYLVRASHIATTGWQLVSWVSEDQ